MKDEHKMTRDVLKIGFLNVFDGYQYFSIDMTIPFIYMLVSISSSPSPQLNLI